MSPWPCKNLSPTKPSLQRIYVLDFLCLEKRIHKDTWENPATAGFIHTFIWYEVFFCGKTSKIGEISLANLLNWEYAICMTAFSFYRWRIIDKTLFDVPAVVFLSSWRSNRSFWLSQSSSQVTINELINEFEIFFSSMSIVPLDLPFFKSATFDPSSLCLS